LIHDGRQSVSRQWQPVLEGAQRDRALTAIDEVAAALAEADVDGGEFDVADGSAGVALFFAYLADASGHDGHRNTSRRFLRHATHALRSRRMGPSLYGGFAGVGWVVEHFDRHFDTSGEERARPIDDALIRLVDRSPWRGEYDLVSGLVGFGVYARERLPHPRAVELLGLVVARLDELAERVEAGAQWPSVAERLPPELRTHYPDRYYNLGLAHGSPGVAAILGAACEAGIDRARPLLEQTVAWILDQRLEGRAALFPRWHVPGEGAEPARSAWCYGDPGVAAALVVASRGAGEPSWQAEALEIARVAARRPTGEAGVKDAGLCHGAAGLAHIFNRMHQVSGDPVLADAARTWFTRALDLRRPDTGFAGFASYSRAAEDGEQWHADRALLTGAAGAGLALLAATEPIDPAWDRILLVS
jgi:lantibiotic modifying enzyme